MSSVVQSLWLMLLGMVGIFAVMGIIMLVVALLNRFTRDQSQENKEISQ